MVKKIIKNIYDSNYVVERRGDYLETKYGYDGIYYHELGIVSVNVCQDYRENYYLIINLIYKNRKYNRQIDFTQKPTQRHMSTLARRFIEEVHKL